ncbi:MAG: UDP-N-acetylmuramoyl-tripeptide--D-alanyl-D-alanine ligase [candidate division Zixibacteria bacterium]|nr:UDP-N-acetylmuramoyl-tripeptide--D-alanyl-D-alanine ligase [candidate division Zixibacteria bacterium]
MLEIRLDELTKVVHGEIQFGLYKDDQLIRGISIDSRNIEKGNLFVAIPGERFDGHQFMKQAAEKGAKAAVMAKDKRHTIDQEIFNKIAAILVKDTKKALRDMASWHRRKFDIPTVAVTGTNGKTTTKDMIAEVLSSRFCVLKSPKSYNNLIGVPLTLFQLNSRSEALVIELGMSSPGEIGILTQISNPSIGVITNIGPAHLESMQSTEKIAQAKFELPECMSSPKTIILNADDSILADRIRQKKKGERVISFGIEKRADFSADRIEVNRDGYISFRVNKDLTINLGLLGKHNIYNALAAFTVGGLLGVDPQKIKQKLERYTPSELRMELVQIRDIRVINDSYNANPASTQKALETLKKIKTAGRKIAVLGDMLELGEKAIDFHLEVGRKVAFLGVDMLLVVGELARFIAQGAKEAGMSSQDILTFENNQQVSFYLLENLKGGELVLVKGSRRMKTEEVVLSLKSLYGRQN